MYIHQYMNLCPPDCPCLFHHLCIFWWKPGWPYVALCVCHSHTASVHTTWLECVHASVDVLMSTHLPTLAKPPMDSYMEMWVPPCISVYVCSSHSACGHTPWLEHVHASVHIFLSTWLLMSAPPPMHILMETRCPVLQCVCPSQPTSRHTPW